MKMKAVNYLVFLGVFLCGVIFAVNKNLELTILASTVMTCCFIDRSGYISK